MSPFCHEQDLDVLPADVADDVDVAEVLHGRHHVRDGLDDVDVGARATPRARRRRSRWRRSRCTSSVAPWSCTNALIFASSSFVSAIGLPFESWYSFLRMSPVLVDAARPSTRSSRRRGRSTRAHASCPARTSACSNVGIAYCSAERVELARRLDAAAGRPIAPSLRLAAVGDELLERIEPAVARRRRPARAGRTSPRRTPRSTARSSGRRSAPRSARPSDTRSRASSQVSGMRWRQQCCRNGR